ncbi:glycosyltransferase [Dehalococcoidales bacterium]|nr:glycosyltransferase [Dehalococcoidales bacterium]
MRIAFITTYGVKCGIATYTEHLAQHLVREHEITIFAEDYRDNVQPDFNSELTIIRCFNRNSPDPRLLEALAIYHPDVVHIQHEYEIFKNLRNTLAQLAAQYPGRTIITLHAVMAIEGAFDLQDCADCFIVHNEYGKRFLVETEGVDAARIKVIPHGSVLIPQLSIAEARRWLGLPQDRKIILSHSYLTRWKNIDQIIKAVAELRHELDIYYVHCGGFHPHLPPAESQQYFSSCLQLIKELNLDSEVLIVDRFLPEEKLGYYLNAADAIIVLGESVYPKISASGVMHTVVPGKPVIAYDDIRYAEFPDDAFYKVKIEGNWLKQAIKDVLSNYELASRLAQNLLNYARATSWEKIAQKHIELYENLCH